jgi:hypothetical protein
LSLARHDQRKEGGDLKPGSLKTRALLDSKGSSLDLDRQLLRRSKSEGRRDMSLEQRLARLAVLPGGPPMTTLDVGMFLMIQGGVLILFARSFMKRTPQELRELQEKGKSFRYSPAATFAVRLMGYVLVVAGLAFLMV